MKNIRVNTAKKRIGKANTGAVEGLLGGDTEEAYDIHTDGKGAEIEMEEANATSSAPPPAYKGPAAVPRSTPSKAAKGKEEINSSSSQSATPAPSSGNNNNVTIDQYPIPQGVKDKMGACAPRFVIMGEGDSGSGLQFVQFLYGSKQEAEDACRHLASAHNITKKGGGPNRVTECASPKFAHIFPTYARMNLFMVRVYAATYDQVFGARPIVKRKVFEMQSGDSSQSSNTASSSGFFGGHSRKSSDGYGTPLSKPVEEEFEVVVVSDSSDEDDVQKVGKPLLEEVVVHNESAPSTSSVSSAPSSTNVQSSAAERDEKEKVSDNAADNECCIM